MSKSSINFYPNPTNGLLNISFQHSENSVSVEIYNSVGIKVQSRHYKKVDHQITIDLAGPPGMYFVKLSDRKGSNLGVIKVVKL